MFAADKIRRKFSQLTLEDRDLTMFTVTDLTLNEKETGNMVYMALKLKRKVATELLTTYLPTILLLLITYTTIFTSKMVRFTAMASPNRSLSKKMVTKVMRSRRMVGR